MCWEEQSPSPTNTQIERKNNVLGGAEPFPYKE